MSDLPSTGHPAYPPGFRARRGINWGFIGLLYTSFYMCRYNFSLANGAISHEFGFSKGQIGYIITTASLAYACGQIVNGLITDKIGGKRAMLIGAAGTIVMNLLFGVASFMGLLWLFVMLRGIDGYLQAYGAPGMIKVNTAWFAKTERGRFAGIFGFMINLGRVGIFQLGPALLTGFTFMGLMQVPPLHWRWLFWVPAGIAAVAAVAMALTVKNTPAEARFAGVHPEEEAAVGSGGPVSIWTVFCTIMSTEAVWFVAAAYACTGAVRQSIEHWFPRLLNEHYAIAFNSRGFVLMGFLIPFVSSLGSLISGYVSDKAFHGRRAPVAMALYFVETGVILLAAQFHTGLAAMIFLVLISFTANATHSILGTAAAMDIGGRRMAGFASGLIDSFQYFGGSLAGLFLGRLLDRSWDNFFYFMAPFGLIGGVLMLVSMYRVKQAAAA